MNEKAVKFVREFSLPHRITCSKKIGQTEVAVLEMSYCQWRNFNANNIDVVIYFCTVICQSLLVCSIDYVRKISDRIDKPLWIYYSNFYWGYRVVCFHVYLSVCLSFCTFLY